MSLRDQRQKEWADKWLETKWGVLNLCPRSGKCRCSINIFRQLENPSILIIHPLEAIHKVWQDEFIKWKYDDANVEYSTSQSLWKLSESPKLYDLIVFDEIHLASANNLIELKRLIDFGNSQVLGLSGTISDRTRLEILEATGLPVIAYYPIEQGIKEGVITDYEIYVVLTELDNTINHIKPSKHKEFYVTEKKRYDWISEKITEAQMEGKDLRLLPIQRMHVLKKSIAKLNLTKRLINKFKGERMLIFCGTTDTADSLGVSVYHSKNKDKTVKDNFCNGNGIDVLATVDMFEAGVTVKPINKAIINSFDSNPENLSQRISRLTGYEYDNPNKKAIVFIICTNTVERKWLSKALEFFDSNKVKYLTA